MFTKLKNVLFGPAVTDTSGSLSVNKTDWVKLGVHALIVGAAAALTVTGEYLLSVDFGQFNPFIVPFVSSVLLFAQKWLKENDVNPTKE